MKKPAAETRQHILDAAKSLMTHKGYTAVGLAEVVTAAGVPKGSFYYYFKSKEEFGEALLNEYFSDYLAVIDSLLSGAMPARERLLAYFRYWANTQGSDLPEGKCLVVKLGAEVCDMSEDMRAVVDRGTQQIVRKLAVCIDEGKEDGSLATDVPTELLAQSLYQLWLGASLMVKVAKQTALFDTTLDMTKRLLA